MEVGAFHVGTACLWFDRLLVAAVRRGKNVIGVEVPSRKRLASKERAGRLGFERRKFNPRRLRQDFVKSGKKSWGVVVEGLSKKELGFLRRFCAVQDILLVVWSDPDPDVSAFPYTHYVMAGSGDDPYISKAVMHVHGYSPPAGIYNREGERIFTPPAPPRASGGNAPEDPEKEPDDYQEPPLPSFAEHYERARQECDAVMRGKIYPYAQANSTIYYERDVWPPDGVDKELWYAFDGSGIIMPFRGPNWFEAGASQDKIHKEIEKHHLDPAKRLYVGRLAEVAREKYRVEPFLKAMEKKPQEKAEKAEKVDPPMPRSIKIALIILLVVAGLFVFHVAVQSVRYACRHIYHKVAHVVVTLKGRIPEPPPRIGFWE